MHVAFYRCHHYPGLAGSAFLGLEMRFQHAYSFPHYLGALDHLRQKHLAFPEEPSHFFHGAHERTLNHFHGAAQGFQFLQHRFGQAFAASLQQAGRYLFGRGGVRGLGHRFFAGGIGRNLGGQLQQALRGTGVLAQDYIFNRLAQSRFHRIIRQQQARVHNAHIQPCLHGMIQENSMHGFPDRIVAAEGKGQVGDAAGGIAAGQVGLNPAHGVYEIYAVAGMFGNAGTHRQHIAVKDDIFWLNTRLREEFVTAGADFRLSFEGGGLAFLVKGHHHHGGTQALDFQSFLHKCIGPFLEGDGVHDTLALGVF